MGAEMCKIDQGPAGAPTISCKTFQELHYRIRNIRLERLQLAVFIDFGETNVISGQFQVGGPLHGPRDSRNGYLETLRQLNALVGNEEDYFYGFRFQDPGAVVPLLFPAQDDAQFRGMGALVAAYGRARERVPMEGEKTLYSVARAARQLFARIEPPAPDVPRVALILTDGQFPRYAEDAVELYALHKAACVLCIGLGDGPFVYLTELMLTGAGIVFFALQDYTNQGQTDFVRLFSDALTEVARWRCSTSERR